MFAARLSHPPDVMQHGIGALEFEYLSPRQLERVGRFIPYSEAIYKAFRDANHLYFTEPEHHEEMRKLNVMIHEVLWLRAEIRDCRRTNRHIYDDVVRGLDKSCRGIAHWHDWLNYTVRVSRRRRVSYILDDDVADNGAENRRRKMSILYEELTGVRARLVWEFETLRCADFFREELRNDDEFDEDEASEDENADDALERRLRMLASDVLVRRTLPLLELECERQDERPKQLWKSQQQQPPPDDEELVDVDLVCELLEKYALRRHDHPRVNVDCANIANVHLWSNLWRAMTPVQILGHALPRVVYASPIGDSETNRIVMRDMARVTYDAIARCFEGQCPTSAEQAYWTTPRLRATLCDLFVKLLWNDDESDLVVPLGLLLPRLVLQHHAKRLRERKGTSAALLRVLVDARDCSDQTLLRTPPADPPMVFAYRGLVDERYRLSPYAWNAAHAVEFAYSGLDDHWDAEVTTNALLAPASARNGELTDEKWLAQALENISIVMKRNDDGEPCAVLFPDDKKSLTEIALGSEDYCGCGADAMCSRDRAMRAFRQDGLLYAMANRDPFADAANARCVRLIAHIADGVHNEAQSARRRTRMERHPTT